jgi:hypothetical protein
MVARRNATAGEKTARLGYTRRQLDRLWLRLYGSGLGLAEGGNDCQCDKQEE